MNRQAYDHVPSSTHGERAADCNSPHPEDSQGTAPYSALPRPNIILICCDDLGYGDLGCYGREDAMTPNLDALAETGMRCTQCYSTSPVCSPARAGLLTGRMPYRSGIISWIPPGHQTHLPATEISLARLLKSVGYDTCHVGKWHLNGDLLDPQQSQPHDHGFDHALCLHNQPDPNKQQARHVVRNGQAVGPLHDYPAPAIAEEAITWLDQRADTSKPFFLNMWSFEPHNPIVSDQVFHDQYAGNADPDTVRYLANVTQLDAAVGSLCQALRDRQLFDDTLIIFTSDHGPEYNRPESKGSTGGKRGRKRSLYEGGINVPCLLHWPAGPLPQGVWQQVVYHADLVPSLCQLTGATLPQDRPLDGIDLTQEWFTGKKQADRALYWRYSDHIPGMAEALRLGDWKLLRSHDRQTLELYHLQSDPQECHDCLDEHPDRAAELLAHLQQWSQEMDTHCPSDWRHYRDPNTYERADAKPHSAIRI